MSVQLGLFDEGCEDEQHAFEGPIRAETSVGVLTSQRCAICDLLEVKLARSGRGESE